MTFRLTVVLGLLAFSGATILQSQTISQLSQPYEVNFLEQYYIDNQFERGITVEYSFAKKGFDSQEHEVGALNLYAAQESAQAMLIDSNIQFPEGTSPNDLFHYTAPLTFDGNWGQMNLLGRSREFAATLWASFMFNLDAFPGTLYLQGSLPARISSVDSVQWIDTTDVSLQGNVTAMNAVTSRLASYVQEVGGLDINGWEQRGVGDFCGQLKWFAEFPQESNVMKAARIHASIGVSVPTGAVKNEDIALSKPFGYDGAWGIPLSGGLNIAFDQGFECGFNVDFIWLNSVTRSRRLKTNQNQTDYLLLSKGNATKIHGKIWKFTLLAQATELAQGVTLGATYHFLKQTDSQLVSQSNAFNDSVINSSEMLKEWALHEIGLRAGYTADALSSQRVIPSVLLFGKIPLAGRRAVKGYAIGAEFAIAF